MNLKRLYLIFFILSFVGFDSQNCFSAGEDKLSVGQKAKLFGSVAKEFSAAKADQAKQFLMKAGTFASEKAGNAGTWLKEKGISAGQKAKSGWKEFKGFSGKKREQAFAQLALTRAWADKKYLKTKKSWQAL